MSDRADWDDEDGDAVPATAPPADELPSDWTSAGQLDDDPFANAFTDEIVNVSASDWDVDADVLWGQDASLDLDADPGPAAYDFPV